MKPLRFASFVALCGLLLVGSAHSVQAQNSAPQSSSGAMVKVERPFRVKIGGFFPTNRETKSQVGSNFFSFGGTWDFGKNPGPVPVFYSVFFDSAGKGGTTSVLLPGNTKAVDQDTYNGYTGIGAALRNYLVPENSPYNYYVGGGLGIYQFHSKTPDRTTGESRGKTNTRFGGKFFTGVEMPQGYFGELDYTLPGDSTGNGLTLSIGYRF